MRVGEDARAELLLEESLDVAQLLGFKEGLAQVFEALGEVFLCQKKFKQAKKMFSQALLLSQEIGFRWPIGSCCFELAHLAHMRKQLARAARLLGVVEAISGSSEFAEVPENKKWIDTLRNELGEGGFSRLWAEGKAMTEEQAIQYAVGDE